MAITSRTEFKDYCLRNKYSKWYFNIINIAEKRNWNKKTSVVYVEGHHIIPKSIFKNNDIVYLTAREHFICHLLLTKMLTGKFKSKMFYALHRLSFGNKQHTSEYIKNSNQYEIIKNKCSEYFSERNSNYWNTIDAKTRTEMKIGDKNPMFGKKHSDYCKNTISIKAKQRFKNKENHPLYNKGHSELTKSNMSINSPSKDYSFQFNNILIEVHNLRKFCRDNNLDQGAMTRVNSGKQITHKGYSKWVQ